jgi:hypothetical protein
MDRKQEEGDEGIECENCYSYTKKARFWKSYPDMRTFGLVFKEVYCEECFEK